MSAQDPICNCPAEGSADVDMHSGLCPYYRKHLGLPPIPMTPTTHPPTEPPSDLARTAAERCCQVINQALQDGLESPGGRGDFNLEPIIQTAIDTTTATLRREVEELRVALAERPELMQVSDWLSERDKQNENLRASLAAVTKERDDLLIENGNVRRHRTEMHDSLSFVEGQRDAALASAEAGAKDTAMLDWMQANYEQIERMGDKWWSVNIEEWTPTLRAAIAAATKGEA